MCESNHSIRKSEKCLHEGLIFSFVFSVIVAKYLLKTFEISTWFVIVEPLENKLFGVSEDRFLIVIIDFIPSQVFLILFILALKY